MRDHPSNLLFLCDDDSTRSYADLYGFAHNLKARIGTPDQLLIPGVFDARIVSALAACRLLNQPVVVYRPETYEAAISEITGSAVFLSSENDGSRKPDEDPPENVVDVSAIPFTERIESPEPSFEATEKQITLFTTGTTAAAKPVRITHIQLTAAIQNSAINFCPSVGEQWLLCLPLFHMGGLGVVYRSLAFSSAIRLISGFDEQQAAGAIAQSPDLRYASLVPTQLQRLLPYLSPGRHHLKAVLIGGGPIAPDLLQKARARSIPAIGSYGMTETCGQIAAQPVDEMHNFPPESAGRLFSGNRVQIRDDHDGTLQPPGESGLIFLKGNQIPDPKANPHLSDRFDAGGWFATGDYGYLDDREYLYIQARRSDIIISGGENILPAPVEEALQRFDTITDAGVTGLPDEEWGERVVAVIVGNPPDEEQLKTLKQQLPAYTIPKEWIIVKQIPRNAIGKTDRNALKEIALKNSNPDG